MRSKTARIIGVAAAILGLALGTATAAHASQHPSAVQAVVASGGSNAVLPFSNGGPEGTGV